MTPMISDLTGILISVLLSIVYVLVIYVDKPAGVKGVIDRNDPLIVRDRLKKIITLTLLTIFILPVVLSKLSGAPLGKLYHQYGFLSGSQYSDTQGLRFDFKTFQISKLDNLKCFLLVAILFNGPLIDYLIVNRDPVFTPWQELRYQLSTIQGKRDLIFGPLTEELMYTASIILTLHQTSLSASALIYLPPVFFSFAHLHHAYELYTRGSIPLRMIFLACAFQLAYTFVFGIFTDYLFLRTGNVWACYTVHMFCNFMGFPNIMVNGKLWRMVYWGLFILGMWLFKHYLVFLTESSLSLVEF